MSMHTTQEWHNNAQLNMSQAMNSQRRAHQQIDSSRRAHRDTVDDNLNAYKEFHTSLEQKVKTSYRLIEKLQRRSDSVDASINSTKQSLAMLEAAHRAKDAPLQLCVWRMEQREKRPLREQVRDNVEVTLEEEKATLCETQKRLSEAIKKTKAMINGLENKLEEVRADLDQKQQALGVDEICLRTTHRSFQTVVERTPASPRGMGSGSARLPSAVKAGALHQQVALHESSKNEVSRQKEAMRLSQSAAAREEAAKELRDSNSKLASRCERSAEDAASKTERCLQARINENQLMRRRLETETRETLQKIEHTKHTIAETKQQIKALEEPDQLTSTCASWRKQRATREQITDPVSTKLAEHQNTLLRCQEELRGHNQHEKGLLQELVERRERLKEDLRDKTSSLHIDLNCLTHEACNLNGKASKGISKNKLTKALKVDSSFIPMPPAVGSARGVGGVNLGIDAIPYTVR